jgi:hypothetical protein
MSRLTGHIRRVLSFHHFEADKYRRTNSRSGQVRIHASTVGHVDNNLHERLPLHSDMCSNLPSATPSVVLGYT